MSGIQGSPILNSRWMFGALILLAFLSPGAWLITNLPPVPIAKALNLLTVALWLIALGLGVVATTRLDRRLSLGVVAALVAIAISWLGAGSLFAAFFYDLYANMPLVQWLAFPVMFMLAARLLLDESEMKSSLLVVVCVAALLSAVVAYQQITTATIRVFGSTGYSTTALMPLIPIAVAIASRTAGATCLVMYASALVIGIGAGVFSASTMGLLSVVFSGALAVFVHPAVLHGVGGVFRALRASALLVALLLAAALIFAQVPALSARFIDFHALAAGDRNMLSRVHMWQGAQEMLLDRPLIGFGPSGYRVAAVEYLPPEAFQHIPDRPDSIDPTVYSPQSPHSIIWEIATRLGLLGLIAFIGLFAVWALALRDKLKVPDSAATLRLGLAAGFLSALFALLVNPVIFAVGLFAPVMAGLAVAPLAPAEAENPVRKRKPAPGDSGIFGRLRLLVVASGLLISIVAVWLGYAEMRLAAFHSADPRQALAFFEETLEKMPGHPQVQRQVLEVRLFVARDADEHLYARQAVERAPEHIAAFAPNLVSIAAHSLFQARNTGRTDLSWEQELLDSAAARIPPTPALVAEQLHLAVLTGDPDRVLEALPDAQKWGNYYPFIDDYFERAEALIGDRQ